MRQTSLDVDVPDFAVQQNPNTSVAIPDTRFADLPDPLGDGSLIGTAGLVVERRAVASDGPTSITTCLIRLAADPRTEGSLIVSMAAASVHQLLTRMQGLVVKLEL